MPGTKPSWPKSLLDKLFSVRWPCHAHAVEWDARQIKFYVGGRTVHSVEDTHWHQPLQMNFDGQTMPEWFGLPKAEDLPSTFSIEYVRSWRRAE